MHDTEFSLIGYTAGGLDDYLQPQTVETKTAVIGTAVPVSRSEYYSAGQLGIMPEFEFIINPAEYSGQQVVELLNGDRLRIYRTYKRTPDELEIYCSHAAGLNPTPPPPTPPTPPTPQENNGGQNNDDV